jgi:hypothetical protein
MNCTRCPRRPRPRRNWSSAPPRWRGVTRNVSGSDTPKSAAVLWRTCASRCGEWEKEAAFRKAKVRRGTEVVEIDWAADSAFRCFPIERDPRPGGRLHLFDIATNKALALSARAETRDYVDIVELRWRRRTSAGDCPRVG